MSKSNGKLQENPMSTRFLTLIVAALAIAGCDAGNKGPDDRAQAQADSPQRTTTTTVAAAGAPVPASTEVTTPVPRYADADNDGKVTRSEAKADPILAANFDAYDLDDNGSLDRGEFARVEGRPAREPSGTRPRSEYPH
jgi:hypothetical protein